MLPAGVARCAPQANATIGVRPSSTLWSTLSCATIGATYTDAAAWLRDFTHQKNIERGRVKSGGNWFMPQKIEAVRKRARKETGCGVTETTQKMPRQHR
jgi:hypothetical protein